MINFQAFSLWISIAFIIHLYACGACVCVGRRKAQRNQSSNFIIIRLLSFIFLLSAVGLSAMPDIYVHTTTQKHTETDPRTSKCNDKTLITAARIDWLGHEFWMRYASDEKNFTVIVPFGMAYHGNCKHCARSITNDSFSVPLHTATWLTIRCLCALLGFVKLMAKANTHLGRESESESHTYTHTHTCIRRR